MSVATVDTPEQLDLLALIGDPVPTVRLTYEPGGTYLVTAGGGWRAKWTGSRWGWVFYRLALPWGWESWEPELPYGVDHVEDRAEAIRLLEKWVKVHGDDPRWIDRVVARRNLARLLAAGQTT